MASSTQANKIAISIGKLRIFVRLFDVMHHYSRNIFPVSLTPLALIPIPPFYLFRFFSPFGGMIIKYQDEPAL